MSVYGLLASLAKGNFEGGNSGEKKNGYFKIGRWLTICTVKKKRQSPIILKSSVKSDEWSQ